MILKETTILNFTGDVFFMLHLSEYFLIQCWEETLKVHMFQVINVTMTYGIIVNYNIDYYIELTAEHQIVE